MAVDPGHGGRQGGFSLIEVLVSILIFSFGLLGMAALQGKAAKMSADAEDRGRAALLANEIVSEMWLRHTSSLPAEVLHAWQARLTDASSSGLAAAQGTVTTDTVDGLQVATVTIRWKSVARRAGDPQGMYMTQVAMP